MTALPPLRYLSGADVAAAMPSLPQRLALAEQTLRGLAGGAELPPKIGVHPRPESSFAHAMPAYLPGLADDGSGDRLGMKWVSGNPANNDAGLPGIFGMLLLNDPVTTAPIAILDAGPITAERTAAISGVAIRAFARIVEREPVTRLWIAGEGPEGAALETLAAALGIAANVDFLGHVPRSELEPRLGAAWVQCVPSIWQEPFGLVTIEALARGTPVVASAVGAQPELIVPDRTGRLVPPGDADALANAIGDLLADRDAADRMGDAAREVTLRDFDGDVITGLLLSEFEEIRK